MKKEKNIKVVTCRVGEMPKVEIIENNLKTLQKIVGGRIELIYVGDVLMVCNEEGKVDGLKPNFVMPRDVIVGDVVFIGDAGEEFGSLSSDEIVGIIAYLTSIGRCQLKKIIEEGKLKEMLEPKVVYYSESN